MRGDRSSHWGRAGLAVLWTGLVLAGAATPSWALVGSIFLTGHDPDFHAQAGNVVGARHINQRAIEFIMDPAFNEFVADGIDRFLFVESNPAGVPGGHLRGINGILASGFALGTDFDRHTAATLSGALDRLGQDYSAIVVASDFGGLLTQGELDILNARSADIISFLNQGGGIYAMAESNGGAHLTPAGGRFGFLPFVVSSTAFHIDESGVVVTPFGASLGLTNADVNGNFSHNIFLGTGGLEIVDTDRFGQLLSLAGRGRVTEGGVEEEPSNVIPEPTTLLLSGLGVIGVALRRGRRAS